MFENHETYRFFQLLFDDWLNFFSIILIIKHENKFNSRHYCPLPVFCSLLCNSTWHRFHIQYCSVILRCLTFRHQSALSQPLPVHSITWDPLLTLLTRKVQNQLIEWDSLCSHGRRSTPQVPQARVGQLRHVCVGHVGRPPGGRCWQRQRVRVEPGARAGRGVGSRTQAGEARRGRRRPRYQPLPGSGAVRSRYQPLPGSRAVHPQ